MNGIYLHLLLAEIRDSIIGRQLEEILIRDRLIQIALPERALFISLYPDIPGLYFTQPAAGFNRLRNWGDELHGYEILGVSQSGLHPYFVIELGKTFYAEKKRAQITVSLFRQAPNFGVTIAEARRNLYPRVIAPRDKKSIRELDEKLIRDPGFREKIFTEYEGLDKYLAAELNPKNLIRLQAVLAGAPVRPRLVSVLPLRISFFAPDFIREYASFNELMAEAMRSYLVDRERMASDAGREEKLSRLRGTVEKLKAELGADAAIEEKRLYGELILANIGAIRKNPETVTLFNPYTQKAVEIKLDPAQTPQENAQAYFKEYKRLKRGQPKIQNRIRELESKIAKLTAGGAALTPPAVKGASTKPEKPKPFREFALPSGSVVYVGKNARANDKLTFAFARPDDYFFHVRGQGGAHTLLKARVARGAKPSRSDLMAAAAVAAYFSKAKGQKKVPVSYAPRKYVKKDKKGKPGSVIMMREEVIFVDPTLPEKMGQEP
jgi:predicted ribosome quality control (RQC) complex YloA/Tae2 family protein